MHMKNKPMWITLELTKRCNYSCQYCYNRPLLPRPNGWIKKMNGSRSALVDFNVPEITEALDKISTKSHIHITGGEPFLYPDLISLCKKLTKSHTIDVLTNLSSNRVYEFADSMSPGRVRYIFATVHMTELKLEKQVEDFIKKARYLSDRGFMIEVHYVLYPVLVKRFIEDYRYFMSRGVKLVARPFRGLYRLRRFPGSYNASERKLIEKYGENGGKIIIRKNAGSFKGKSCLAGNSYINIDEYGDAYACYGREEPLGNLMDRDIKLSSKPVVCNNAICPCPEYGFRFVID